MTCTCHCHPLVEMNCWCPSCMDSHINFKQVMKSMEECKKCGDLIGIGNGDGTTYPRGLWNKNITNYIKVEKRKYYPTYDVKVYMHFFEYDGNEIKKILDKLMIPYSWNGDTSKCIVLAINRDQNGLNKPNRRKYE